MFITTPTRKGGATVVRLVRSFRDKGKVKQKVIKTLGQSKDPNEIEYFKKLAFNLKLELETGVKQAPVPLPIPVNVRLSCMEGKTSINDGVQDIIGAVCNYLKFDEVISGTRKNGQWNKFLKYCLFMRFLEPASKLRSVRRIQERFQKLLSYDQVLRMMDHLSSQEETIKEHLLKNTMKKSRSCELLLFDVTTLYFENVTETDLKQFGFSKDNKFNEVQVVLALLTDEEGLPVTYEVFPGNTAETKTLISCLEQLSGKYHIKRVRLTADRALFSKRNMSYFEEKDCGKEGKEFEYIIACPLRKLTEKQKQMILDRSHYKKIDKERSSGHPRTFSSISSCFVPLHIIPHSHCLLPFHSENSSPSDHHFSCVLLSPPHNSSSSSAFSHNGSPSPLRTHLSPHPPDDASYPCNLCPHTPFSITLLSAS